MMLRWAVIFLAIAVIAALLGFTGIAGTSAFIAKVLFIVCLVLFIAGLIAHLVGNNGRSSINP